MTTTVVLGAGQAGLAVAALLQAAGERPVVLDRAAVGDSWRRHYDRLTLNTDRRLSGLPGLAVPASEGQWVSRDGFADYLADYARHHDLDVRRADVTRVDRDGDGWLLHGPDLRADRLVVATGANRVPHVPSWPGTFDGPVVHSGDYRNPSSYDGRVVMVVGAGNSGAEIAADLAESPARQVLLAVKDDAALLPRAWGPVPTQLAAFGLQGVPAGVADLGVWAMASVRITERRRGLRPPRRAVSDARRGVVPVLDAGLREAVRSGRVRVVGPVSALDGGHVVLADGGRVGCDVVVAATGWRAGLEPLVGDLGVLDERGLPVRQGGRAAAPGLHFVGYGSPLTGYVHAAGYEAREVVAALTGGGLVSALTTSLRKRLPLPA